MLVAVGTNLFFVPNNVVSGGVTGISIIAHHLFRTPVGLVVLLLNLPLLWLGWRFAGGMRFFVRTAVSVVVLSLAIDLSAPFLVPPTHDRLLVICYGGLVDGLGMGLVFRGRGTTGGTDVLARLAHRYLGVGVGQALLAINVVIFGAAAFVFGAEAVMVALALAFVSARVLDLVQAGFSAARSALIISTRPGRRARGRAGKARARRHGSRTGRAGTPASRGRCSTWSWPRTRSAGSSGWWRRWTRPRSSRSPRRRRCWERVSHPTGARRDRDDARLLALGAGGRDHPRYAARGSG